MSWEPNCLCCRSPCMFMSSMLVLDRKVSLSSFLTVSPFGHLALSVYNKKSFKVNQNRLGGSFFIFEFTFSRTYDPGFRCFVKQMFKTGGKKNVPSSFFPAKNGLKQWWTELSYCTRSPLLTYKITVCLLARSGFARSGPIYCHIYATILLMPTAYRHTSWYRNLFIVIF